MVDYLGLGSTKKKRKAFPKSVKDLVRKAQGNKCAVCRKSCTTIIELNMIIKMARIGITEQQTVRQFMLDVMIGKAEHNQQQELKRQKQKRNLTHGG